MQFGDFTHSFQSPHGSSSTNLYSIPPQAMPQGSSLSVPTFDAKSQIEQDKTLAAVLAAFQKEGVCHVVNTCLASLPSPKVLQSLGFGPDHIFGWGGNVSGRTLRLPLGAGFHTVDSYPAGLFLLPHNEIMYQPEMPRTLLFYCIHPGSIGGRTFVHSSKQIRTFLERTKVGQDLVACIVRDGYTFTSGYPSDNTVCTYLRTWKERFATSDPDVALQRALVCNDRAWWQDNVLMVENVINALVPGEQGEDHLLIPRIAKNPGAPENGFRRYRIGNRHLTPDEIELLLKVFLYTAQGCFWQQGDILLVDNLRFAHSREPYQSNRKIGVLMSGMVKNFARPLNFKEPSSPPHNLSKGDKYGYVSF
jgi:hypothetical protein